MHHMFKVYIPKYKIKDIFFYIRRIVYSTGKLQLRNCGVNLIQENASTLLGKSACKERERQRD